MQLVLWIAGILYVAGSSRRYLFAAALIAESYYMVSRGLLLGRLPLLGPHDTLVFFALSIAIMACIISFTPVVKKSRWFLVSSGLAAGLFTLIALAFKPSFMPLPQILDTLWFELHVVLAFFSYALFLLGGILSGAYLLRHERTCLDVQFKMALVGWTFFSASMIAGGIWGYYAWGTYWLWTAKELWTSILWLYYVLLLHVRLKGSEWDRASAWLGIIGVFVMLFTYLGVSMLMKSSHSF
jgi:ABC-type transport system involved in cytochrome c biogenesis permease subunit